MFSLFERVLAVVILAGGAAACARAGDDAPPVATPSITLSSPVAAIGKPIEMTYRFAVAPDAPPFAMDYAVFVHFIDSNDELMWTDDHEPPTPTRQWKPGATIEYRRTMFVPKFPYVGETRVEMGLYSPQTGERLPLSGQADGQRAYQVAIFDLRLESDELFVVFQGGWHETEVGGEGPGREWQWSRKDATLSFRNPQRDVLFYLQADQPVAAAFAQPQRVDIRLGDEVIDSFSLPAGPIDVRRIDLPGSRLGTADTVEVTISVDKTFVPADVPGLGSSDTRELGIRVFRAFVQPM